jgi:hypothetical protein
MTKRIQVSLPDPVADLLKRLAADCEMSESQCVTQFIRRYHDSFRELFAIDCDPQPVPEIKQSPPNPDPPTSVAFIHQSIPSPPTPAGGDLLALIANS